MAGVGKGGGEEKGGGGGGGRGCVWCGVVRGGWGGG
jgi:hypothetical protein